MYDGRGKVSAGLLTGSEKSGSLSLVVTLLQPSHRARDDLLQHRASDVAAHNQQQPRDETQAFLFSTDLVAKF